MRTRARSACIWPDEAALELWWQHTCRLDQVVLGQDDTMQGLGESPVVILHQGQHLAPGAVYQVEDSGLTVGEVQACLGGAPTVRTVHAAYRGRASGAAAVVDLVGLDRPRTLSSAGTLPHLQWRLAVGYDRDRLLSDIAQDPTADRVERWRLRARRGAAHEHARAERAYRDGMGVIRDRPSPNAAAAARRRGDQG